jgi:hypothetical protein
LSRHQFKISMNIYLLVEQILSNFFFYLLKFDLTAKKYKN